MHKTSASSRHVHKLKAPRHVYKLKEIKQLYPSLGCDGLFDYPGITGHEAGTHPGLVCLSIAEHHVHINT